jgi:hypothetical protein
LDEEAKILDSRFSLHPSLPTSAHKKPRGDDSQRRFGLQQGNLTAVGLEVMWLIESRTHQARSTSTLIVQPQALLYRKRALDAIVGRARSRTFFALAHRAERSRKPRAS